MKNSADLGGCYPPRPSASVDNTLLDLQNSSYPTQSHSIIAKYYRFRSAKIKKSGATLVITITSFNVAVHAQVCRLFCVVYIYPIVQLGSAWLPAITNTRQERAAEIEPIPHPGIKISAIQISRLSFLLLSRNLSNLCWTLERVNNPLRDYVFLRSL